MITPPDLYKCKLCGSPLHENDDLCGDCGTPCTPVETTQDLCFCSACGSPLRGGDDFCSDCGAPHQCTETGASSQGERGSTEGTLAPPTDGDSTGLRGDLSADGGTSGHPKNKLLIYMLTGVAALLLIVVLIFVLQPEAVLSGSSENPSAFEAVSETAPAAKPSPTPGTAAPASNRIDEIPSPTPINETPSPTPMDGMQMLYLYYCFVCPSCGWRQAHHIWCDSCNGDVSADTIREKWFAIPYETAGGSLYDLNTEYKNQKYKRFLTISGERWYYDLREESQSQMTRGEIQNFK